MIAFLPVPTFETTVRRAFSEGVMTPDLGGSSSTVDVGRWICDVLSAGELSTSHSNG